MHDTIWLVIEFGQDDTPTLCGSSVKTGSKLLGTDKEIVTRVATDGRANGVTEGRTDRQGDYYREPIPKCGSLNNNSIF